MLYLLFLGYHPDFSVHVYKRGEIKTFVLVWKKNMLPQHDSHSGYGLTIPLSCAGPEVAYLKLIQSEKANATGTASRKLPLIHLKNTPLPLLRNSTFTSCRPISYPVPITTCSVYQSPFFPA